MMPIACGTPITAPNGYLNLQAETVYYFVRSSPITEAVLLVRFLQRDAKLKEYKSVQRPKRLVTPQPVPMLERMPREAFEHGVRFGRIKPEVRTTMPPWLDGLEGLNLANETDRKRGAKISHQDRIDQKLFAISGLVQAGTDLLDIEDIEGRINQHARSLKPRQNETRLRLWYFTYLLFGRNRNALHYPTHKIGNWDRLKHPSVVKRGAPGYGGAGHGYNTTAKMHDCIIKSYTRECGLGVTQRDIYTAAMRKDFGCRSRLKADGKTLELYHPAGEPFPTKATYFYHVRVKFDPLSIKLSKHGRNKTRSNWQATRGSFSEHCWNLMQRVESDAYRVRRLPKGYIEGSDLKPLVVITKRDSASGRITGIGFSVGAETAPGYRMATFCEAIGLPKFASFFGITLRDPVGRSCGIAASEIRDRGPGSTPQGMPRDAELVPVGRELTPARAGQSKGIVETSNPKAAKDDDGPSFIRSNLTVAELAKEELFAVATYNEATNVASRIDPAIADLVATPSPNGVWDALERLGRNDSVQVGFDEAVRAFLEVVPATLKRNGVEMAGRNYYAKTPEFEAALQSVAASGGLPVKVYVLTSCIRHIWFEWRDRLIELMVRYPVPVATEVKYMSLEEAVEYAEYAKRRDHESRGHANAAILSNAEDYHQQTGLQPSRGQRVAGRPRRGSVVAKQEASEAARGAAGKKAA